MCLFERTCFLSRHRYSSASKFSSPQSGATPPPPAWLVKCLPLNRFLPPIRPTFTNIAPVAFSLLDASIPNLHWWPRKAAGEAPTSLSGCTPTFVHPLVMWRPSPRRPTSPCGPFYFPRGSKSSSDWWLLPFVNKGNIMNTPEWTNRSTIVDLSLCFFFSLFLGVYLCELMIRRTKCSFF